MAPSVRDDLEIDAYDIISRSARPQHHKMKERFQATIAYLRENISSAIESDLRDFGGSSHLPYQGLRALREGATKLLGASAGRADRSILARSKSPRRYTRHCVNSAFPCFYGAALPTFRSCRQPLAQLRAAVDSSGESA
jgi:hypothetical protein